MKRVEPGLLLQGLAGGLGPGDAYSPHRHAHHLLPPWDTSETSTPPELRTWRVLACRRRRCHRWMFWRREAEIQCFFPPHMQEDVGLGSWINYHQHPNHQTGHHPHHNSHNLHHSHPHLNQKSPLACLPLQEKCLVMESSNPNGLYTNMSLPESSKAPHTPTPAGYYGQIYGSSQSQPAFTSHLGQLSPPPETSAATQVAPPSLDAVDQLGPSAEFWGEVDRIEFDQYLSTSRTRLSRNAPCEESSALISALSDASSAVYYSACLTG